MDGDRLSRERSEIAAKRQRGAALQAEALRLFAEADEQARLLELARLELPPRRETVDVDDGDHRFLGGPYY